MWSCTTVYEKDAVIKVDRTDTGVRIMQVQNEMAHTVYLEITDEDMAKNTEAIESLIFYLQASLQEIDRKQQEADNAK